MGAAMRPGFDFRGRLQTTDPVGAVSDDAWRDGYNSGRADARTDSGRLEAVFAWAEDYFGDATLFPAGLAVALFGAANPYRADRIAVDAPEGGA